MFAYAIATAIAGFCIWFTMVFSSTQPAIAAACLIQTWAWSQAFAVLLIHPFLLLIGIMWSLIARPVVAPYVAWLPAGLGRLLAGRAALEMISAAHVDGALTRRLERLVIPRAACVASGLPVEYVVATFPEALDGVAAAISDAHELGAGTRECEGLRHIYLSQYIKYKYPVAN